MLRELTCDLILAFISPRLRLPLLSECCVPLQNGPV